MPVDVLTETEIARPRDAVAAYAGNPDNAPEWYENIASVRRQAEPPLGVGSKPECRVACAYGRGLDGSPALSQRRDEEPR